MEIQPASITQVRKGKDGRNIVIEDDVLSIARGLLDIDPVLRLAWNEDGHYFMVYWWNGPKKEVVLTSQEMTPAILDRLREIIHPSYDFVGEMERMDKQAEKNQDHRFSEETGEIGEHLAHAVRKDLEHGGKIFVKRDVKNGES